MKKLVCLILFSVAPVTAFADDHSTLSIMLENDSFIDQIDRHYTNGIYASWTGLAVTRDDGVAAVVSALMLPGGENPQWRTTWFGGQSMFTPENLEAAIPPATDRPYAGWLYGGARLYRDSGDVLDRIDIQLGLVGPGSLASDLQRAWHSAHLLGGVYPNGWHYQLRGEPGLVLSEQRTWRVPLSHGSIESELLPEINASAGNIFTYGGAGFTLRAGSGLKADWGAPRIAPGLTGSDYYSGDAFGWYVFAGVESRIVARNLFLSGNSFEDSARVSGKPLVTDATVGAALMFPAMRVTASYINRSAEFRGQKDNDQFVSIDLSVAN